MFSSWDLVRPRFWYPMSSLEQSMMELEHMTDLMTRSRFPFAMGSEMLAAPSNLDDDDDFFRDLPVHAREHKPATKCQVAAVQPQMERESELQPQATAARDNDPNKAHAEDTPKSTPRSANRAQSQHFRAGATHGRAIDARSIDANSVDAVEVGAVEVGESLGHRLLRAHSAC
ncbi:hypothetical protein PR003_g32477 [Phytophthora rubi]|uniref:Uncharacterized protein n=1 Tax=Phytophthora rubi TaxID=129364 RepID=A0A6A3GHB1_9STRA|nr:hypothetical protein PR001_g31237 [Phytophthora rubi]KAE9265373.1 hypothetical protein PR003_g32477 [Phytophthora rubi]